MGVLTKNEIWAEMRRSVDPLVITPLLEEKQIGWSSVDVRLGHEFIVLRRAAVDHIDPTDGQRWKVDQHKSQHKIRIALRKGFVLHPGQLVLGASLEYLAIPSDLAGSVEGRSSWGRLGLIVATAAPIAPGFKGCITLELVNDGEVPIVLYPGVRIAQILFQRSDGQITYSGKYDCPTGPEFTRLHKDEEMHIWGPRRLNSILVQ